jgi:hypothetical protein
MTSSSARVRRACSLGAPRRATCSAGLARGCIGTDDAPQGATHIEIGFGPRMQHCHPPLKGVQTSGPLHQRPTPGMSPFSVGGVPPSTGPASARQRTVKSSVPDTLDGRQHVSSGCAHDPGGPCPGGPHSWTWRLQLPPAAAQAASVSEGHVTCENWQTPATQHPSGSELAAPLQFVRGETAPEPMGVFATSALNCASAPLLIALRLPAL